ncbi:hypothetical protein [Microbacterium sp. BF1]|uniref:hypothetical protein n=1 Tax=Microbacterium sp. BF1 TaxID=2821146 RepID=UPI001C4E116A|nr:hypothetical protein [Microbacterium sp. BF1]
MFTAETELGRPVASWLRSTGGVCIAEEVAVGYGVPDMVAGVGERRQLSNRRRQVGPVTDTLQLALLEYCRTSRTEDELREWAPGAYSDLLRRALRPLLEQELLTATLTGYRARRQPRDPFERLVAVELKLRVSERGFAQAYAYRLFAESSYLAVPAARIRPVHMERARHLGIGLLAVFDDRCEEVVEPEERSLVTPNRRRLASEQVLAASLRVDGPRAGAPARSLVLS